MKKLISLFVFLVYCYESTAQEKSTPQPLTDIQDLKNRLETKADVVGRFYKLLTLVSSFEEAAEKQQDYPTKTFPFISKSFRRLNIFGLQAPPDDPPRNADGTPCSCNTKELQPDILHVTDDSGSKSNFYVVQPVIQRDNDQKSTNTTIVNHYPKLNFGNSPKTEQVTTSTRHPSTIQTTTDRYYHFSYFQ
ncbi:CLUMA_CG000668, isoform A [Clunio marinus]|uniref:CLUMA_CG000668, isoform A n=1 Tax=Clunio marinus TaxID=568069 RepID=A0A1J1HFR7_9DIPT|nr:CLUMA_CG000668, isoform A [Clunio marinus]